MYTMDFLIYQYWLTDCNKCTKPNQYKMSVTGKTVGLQVGEEGVYGSSLNFV